MKADKIKNIAQNLYVHGGLSQAEIARQVGKTPTQINRWAKKYKWQQLRAAHTITPDEVIKRTYAQIQAIYDYADFAGRPVDSTETDQISKLMAGVRQLKKEADLSLYAQVVAELTRFVRQADEGLLEDLIPYQMAFLKHKAIELSNE